LRCTNVGYDEKIRERKKQGGQEQEELVSEDVNSKIVKPKEKKHLSDCRLVPKRKKVLTILTAALQENNTIHW
jgi:hypothetical protein